MEKPKVRGGRCAGCLVVAAVAACGDPTSSAGPVPDAHVEVDAAANDGRACYGTGPLRICLAAAPTTPRVFGMGTLNTSAPGACDATVSGADGLCVVAATQIEVNGRLRVIGAKPLVLLASDLIETTIAIDVASHRLNQKGDPEIGAGADAPACDAGTPPVAPGGPGGGGAGGSLFAPGGDGGRPGGGVTSALPGRVTGMLTDLRGGCPGQDGAGLHGGVHGHGGGAVYLIAGNRIYLGGIITVGGEGGAGAARSASGGGGGGSGGMIGLDAPNITVTSMLIANGGGGGEGSEDAVGGHNGQDAHTVSAAGGGRGGTSFAGAGGDGGDGVTLAGGGGLDGSDRNGGGGGGGGVGIILAPAAADLGAQVSPPATRF